MNERIRELAAVARHYTKDTVLHLERVHNRDYSFEEINEIFDAKFAELLVKECMKLCTEVKEDLVGIVDNDKRDLAEMGVTFCYEAIKSEFGVEE